MVKVLFVCLGNICRSTMAEAVMRYRVAAAGLEGKITVDSAGTSRYNLGSPPHHGTRKKLDEHGIPYDGIFARQIAREDIENFDYIVCMDSENFYECRSISNKDSYAKLYYLADFAPGGRFPHGKDVPDPYYTGNFELTYELVCLGCDGLLEYIIQLLN